MDLSTFIVSVFCLVDDRLKGRGPLRRRGPAPRLSDSEVITVEAVGEFLGLDTDAGLHRFFSRHYAHFFPALRSVHRTTFARQAAKLFKAKEQIWRELFQGEDATEGAALLVVDSFPLPACKKARSHRCKVLWEAATHGRDASSGGFFYGMRAHLLVLWPGVIVGTRLAPANVHDLHPAEGMLREVGRRGRVLGDRNYWSPRLAGELLAERGLRLLSPFKVANGSPEGDDEGDGWSLELSHRRRRIETVISQLVGRYNAKKVWARDLWHLRSRWMRKVLSHTVAFVLCRREGLSPLRFSELLTN